MQTWVVHMREPRRLRRELGLGAFLTFQLIVGGNVLASLVHPFMLIWLLGAFTSGAAASSWSPMVTLFGATVVFGYLVSAVVGAVGLSRRGLLAYCWVLLLMPVHWLMLSAAAWRAVYQVLVEPYRWEKTEHGVARTSRQAARKIRSLSMLERHLSSLGLPL